MASIKWTRIYIYFYKILIKCMNKYAVKVPTIHMFCYVIGFLDTQTHTHYIPMSEMVYRQHYSKIYIEFCLLPLSIECRQNVGTRRFRLRNYKRISADYSAPNLCWFLMSNTFVETRYQYLKNEININRKQKFCFNYDRTQLFYLFLKSINTRIYTKF